MLIVWYCNKDRFHPWPIFIWACGSNDGCNKKWWKPSVGEKTHLNWWARKYMLLAFRMIFSNPFVPVPRRLSWRELAPVWRQLHAKSQEAGSTGPLAVSFSPTVLFERTTVIHNCYSRPSRLQRLFTKYVVRSMDTWPHRGWTWQIVRLSMLNIVFLIIPMLIMWGRGRLLIKRSPWRHVSSSAETRQLSRDRWCRAHERQIDV